MSKRVKQVLGFLLMTVIVCLTVQTAAPVSAAAKDYSFKYGKIKYRVLKEAISRKELGEVAIVGIPSNYDAQDIKIPLEVWDYGKGYTVVAVDDKAFYHSNITSIVLSETVRSIGDFAFASNLNLKEVYIPEACESIGQGAFSYTGLTQIDIPDSVKKIGKAAFYACGSLETINFGAGVSSLGVGVFWECNSLKELNFSENNKSFKAVDGIVYSGDGKKLITAAAPQKDVVILDSAESISDYAFEECEKVESVVLGKSLKTIGVGAFFACKSLKSVSGGRALEEIGENAFYDCGRLKEFDFGKKLKTIGGTAFQNCVKLKSVELPKTLTKIDGNVFAYCTSLTNISIADGGTYSVVDGMIIGSKGKKLIACPTAGGKITIPSSVEVIGEWAFQGNTNIEGLTVSSNVKKILTGAFYGCSSISRIKFLSLSIDLSAKSVIDTPSGKIACGIFYGIRDGALVEYPSGADKAMNKLDKALTRHCPDDVFIVTY